MEQELPTDPSVEYEFTPGFKLASRCSIFSFLCSILWIVVCPFVLFRLVIVLSVFRFTDSDYPFGIFKLFLSYARWAALPILVGILLNGL